MEEYEALQAKLKTLLKKETSSEIRYEKNKERFELAGTRFNKESEDVEKLLSESLTTFLKRIIGNYDKKLDKEMKEQLIAKMELDLSLTLLIEARENLAAVQSSIEQTSAQIKQLKTILYTQDPYFYEKITLEEIKHAQLKQELLELDEAYSAGNKVLKCIDDALKDLDSADSISTWDMFTNKSFLLDMMKYDKINQAEDKMSQLEQVLENYKKELKDLSLDTHLNYETFSSMNKTFDIFFDNFFSDWNTKEKIGRNSDMLKTLSGSIANLQDKLEVNKQELQNEIKELDILF